MLILLFILAWSSEALVYANLFLGVGSIILWLWTQFSNPGYITKPKEMDFLKLMQIVDPIQLCPDCLVIRTPRSRHCSTCNCCVERFDHHCPWINNCIGVRNHIYFIWFLIFIFSTIVTVFASTLYQLIQMHHEEACREEHLFYAIFPVETTCDLALRTVVSVFLLIVTGFFLGPVLLLFYIQIRNLIVNRTTNERFSRRPPQKRRSSSSMSVVSGDRTDSTGSSLLSAN